jgi:hypothetical protein
MMTMYEFKFLIFFSTVDHKYILSSNQVYIGIHLNAYDACRRYMNHSSILSNIQMDYKEHKIEKNGGKKMP